MKEIPVPNDRSMLMVVVSTNLLRMRSARPKLGLLHSLYRQAEKPHLGNESIR